MTLYIFYSKNVVRKINNSYKILKNKPNIGI